MDSYKDDFGGAAAANQLPKTLQWPIKLYQKGSNFAGWLTTIENNQGLTAQRLAQWVDGHASYGFDDAPDPGDSPPWKGARMTLLGGG